MGCLGMYIYVDRALIFRTLQYVRSVLIYPMGILSVSEQHFTDYATCAIELLPQSFSSAYTFLSLSLHGALSHTYYAPSITLF